FRCLPQGRGREVVSDHQGSRHQGGMKRRVVGISEKDAMKLPRRRFLHLAAGAAALPAVSRIARAQDWPTRPVTMVVPYAAGGPLDTGGRIVAPVLSERLGQQVIVENVVGAGGMTGAARVAKAAPDGYQFVLGNSATHAQNQSLYKRPMYNPVTDLSPVTVIYHSTAVLIARKDFPAKTLGEFNTYVKANQATLQYGSGGAGSASHTACVLLNSLIGVSITHVPYRGAAPAMQDLVGGRIDYMCNYIFDLAPSDRSGRCQADCAAGAASQPYTSRSRNRSRAGSQGLRRRRLDGVFSSEGDTLDDCSAARARDQRCLGHAGCEPTLRGPRTARCSAGGKDARISCQAC